MNDKKPTTLYLADCRTTSGAAVNTPCHFPFTFGGLIHWKCTMDSDIKYWCATEGQFSVTKWGVCSESCPLENG